METTDITVHYLEMSKYAAAVALADAYAHNEGEGRLEYCVAKYLEACQNWNKEANRRAKQ